jgi:hypothetical protein
VEGNNHGLIVRHYLGICLKGLRKTTEDLNHNSWSLDKDVNQRPPEYEAGVLTTPP